MKLLLSLLSLVVMLQITRTVAQTEPCVTGHTYYDGCNQCTCLGPIYACTERACKEQSSKDSPKVQKREISTDKSKPCAEGHSYEEDCNTCLCTSTGVYVCTLKECYHGPQFSDTKPINEPQTVVERVKTKRQTHPEPCTEDHSYSDGCNTCRCVKGGHYACTLMFCFKPTLPVADPNHVNEVTESSNNIDSSSKIKRQVLTNSEPCVEGQSYEEDCNTCRCTNTGIYACTRRACYHGPQFPDTVEIETQTNKPAKRNSREIEAVIGKYDLPKSSDLNHLRFAAESCTPHEVKNEQCNRCKCTKNGRGWICTRKVCPTQEQ